jgi:hypothetical protein
VKSGIATFEMIAELQRLAERAFVYKLKQKRPDITDLQVDAELSRWYKDRPGADFGDGVGRVGDPSRFR